MPRRIPGSLISVNFSTRGSLMPAWMYQHVAADAGLTGIDVDATTPAGAWLATRGLSRDRAYVPTRTVWVPVELLHAPRTSGLLEAIAAHQDGAKPEIVAVMPSMASRELGGWIQKVISRSDDVSVTVGLPSSLLRGGRPHLVQLGAMRRLAEEWDLPLAIDLSGRFDPTWEAEAAITRLGDRLRLIRVRDSAPSRGAVGLDRVACRALHAVVDRGKVINIAICPARLSPFPATPRAAAVGARRAADYTADRANIQAEALRDGIDHFEQSRTMRGF